MTATLLYNIVSALGITIDLMSFAALFPAVFGTLAVLIIYFLGKDIGGKPVGLFASLFLALSPSFIQRTSLGFFDDETVGIVALLLFAFMFLRAIEEDRPVGSTVKYSVGSGLALAYFISDWGAAFYPIGLTVLFVFVLVVLKRYTRHLLLSYSITFGLGLFVAINIPYLSTSYLITFGILPVGGMFVLLCLTEIIRNLTSARSKLLFVALFLIALIAGFVLIWQLGYMGSVAGKFVSVLDPFARSSSPLIESVAEHRISSWSSVYYEFGIGILFFIAGLYFIMKNLNNRNLFVLLFGLTSLYFASSMVRLLVLMAPAFGLMASIGIVGVLKPFFTLLREQPKGITKKKYSMEHVSREFSGVAIFLIFIILMTNFAFAPQSGGTPKVYRQAYAPVTITAGSLPIAPNAPVQEWFNMLAWTKTNLDSTTVVTSWWDYGYWLSLLGNVTSLCDNATINGTSIENVGFVFMANEEQALEMLKLYNAKYVLVFTTLSLSQTSSGGAQANWAGYGDEGKWTWMARISGQARERFISSGFVDGQSAWANETLFGSFSNETSQWVWNDTYGKNSTIYKLMSWGKDRWCTTYSVENPDDAVQPEYFEEAYFAGLDLAPQQAADRYGGLVPLVLLYRVNYPPPG
jgi:dolichyl-diphosphooligosaccharide--protein glycosyltransferase